MGWHNINLSSLIIILILAITLFGTKKLRNAGQDIAIAIKGFKEGLNENKQTKDE